MPIAAGATGPELPNVPSMGGLDFAECLSPGATPKVNIPSAVTNCPTDLHWSQNSADLNCEAAPQMMYAPSTSTYGCPPGALMLLPFPCMMDHNGQPVQFPCPADQVQPLSWASGLHSNAFHMPCLVENEPWQEENGCTAVCKDASQQPAEIDLPATEVGPWFEKPQGPAAFEEDVDEPLADMPLPDDVVALGNPRQILANAGLASSVEDLLESSDRAKRAAIITWMLPAVWELALSANGTRVIQKALEVTGGDTQIKLSQCLHGRARQLLDSPHGNHVLQKSIVMMPPNAVQFIFHELSFYRGGWASVACHRFGCRVVERLLEHCEAGLTSSIVAAVVAEMSSLSRHPYANYVVQHILEHVPAHRSQVVNALIQVGVPMLAQHRVSSNIIERAFEHSVVENQRALAEAVLSTPYAIVEMGCSRYGSFTVRRMLEKLEGTLRYMALQQLAESIPTLRASKHGRHIAARVSAALSKMHSTYP